MTEDDKTLVERLRYLGAIDRLMGEPLYQAADRIEALITENERLRGECAAIVAWLRGTEPYPDGHDIADDIEAGEHLK